MVKLRIKNKCSSFLFYKGQPWQRRILNFHFELSKFNSISRIMFKLRIKNPWEILVHRPSVFLSFFHRSTHFPFRFFSSCFWSFATKLLKTKQNKQVFFCGLRKGDFLLTVIVDISRDKASCTHTKSLRRDVSKAEKMPSIYLFII